jgi:hypothetical protein
LLFIKNEKLDIFENIFFIVYNNMSTHNVSNATEWNALSVVAGDTINITDSFIFSSQPTITSLGNGTTLEGNGHTITHSYSPVKPMVTVAHANATVRNLKLNGGGGSITSDGLLFNGSGTRDGTIEYVNVSNVTITGADNCGGLGNQFLGTIRYCTTSATIDDGDSIGGLIGSVLSGGTPTIEYCTFTGIIGSTTDPTNSRGGLVGTISNDGAIVRKCYSAPSSATASAGFGGIIGKISGIDSVTTPSNLEINELAFVGPLSSNPADEYGGGIIGVVDGSSSITVNNAYVDVTSVSLNNGGVIGSVYSSTINFTELYSEYAGPDGNDYGRIVGNATSGSTLNYSYGIYYNAAPIGHEDASATENITSGETFSTLTSIYNGIDQTSIDYTEYSHAEIAYPDNVSEMNSFFDNDVTYVDVGTALDINGFTLTKDNYAIEFNGLFYASEAGSYDFVTSSDDASDLFINDQLVAHWYGAHGGNLDIIDDPTLDANQVTGSITLTQGYHRLRARFMEVSGGDHLTLFYNAPSSSNWSYVPPSAFNKDSIEYFDTQYWDIANTLPILSAFSSLNDYTEYDDTPTIVTTTQVIGDLYRRDTDSNLGTQSSGSITTFGLITSASDNITLNSVVNVIVADEVTTDVDTNGGITGNFNGGITDLIGQLIASDSAISTEMTNVSGSANIHQTYVLTVNTVVNPNQGELVANTTTGPGYAVFGGGISDIGANMATSGDILGNLSAIVANDADVAITVVGAEINVGQGANIINATSGTKTLSVGINDSAANLFTAESPSTNLTTVTTEDGTLDITANTAVTAGEGNSLAGVTSGTVVYLGGVSDTGTNLTADGAIESELSAIVAEDSDVVITVTDAVTVNEAKNIATSTTGTVTFSAGISDVKDNYVSSYTETTSKFDDAIAAGGDPDVIITVTSAVTANEGDLIMSKTTAPGYAVFNAVTDASTYLVTDASITANLTAITKNKPLFTSLSSRILYFDFNDINSYSGSGSITDLEGNSDGTVSGTTHFNNCYQAIEFDGTSDYVITDTSLNLQLSPANTSTVISLFTWFYPTGDGVIISEQGTTTLDTNWYTTQIQIISGTTHFAVWPYTISSNASPVVASSVSTPLNQWHYLGMTYDGTTLKTYVNGQSAGQVISSRDTPYNDGVVGGKDLHYALAYGSATNFAGGQPYGVGKMGTFEVYNTALSQSEITDLYNNTYRQWTCFPVNITVTDAVTVNEGKNIALASNGITTFSLGISDVKENYISDYTTITNNFVDAIGINGDPDTVVTVTNVVSANEGDLIASQTIGPGYATFDGGVTDTIVYLATDSAITDNLNVITNNDSNVAVTVTDTVTVNEARNIAIVTGGTVSFSSGISDVKDNYITSNVATTSKFDDAIGAGGDPDVTITITDVVDAQEGDLIASQITGPGYATFSGGLTDSVSNLAIDSGITANLTAITNNDNNVAITITSEVTANEGNHIASATTGTVVYSIGVNDVAINLSVDGAIESELSAIVSEDSDVNINVQSEVTVNQGSNIALSTTGTIDFLIGINDVIKNYVTGFTSTTTKFDNAIAVGGDPDAIIKVSDGVTANEGDLMITTIPVANQMVLQGGVSDAVAFLTTDEEITSNLTAITANYSDIAINVTDEVTINEGLRIGQSTTGSITFAIGVNDTKDKYVNDYIETLVNFDDLLVEAPNAVYKVKDAVTANEGETISNLTAGSGYAEFTAGVSDKAQYLSTATAITNELLATVTADSNVNITVTDEVNSSVAQLIANASTGAIEFSIGINDVVSTLTTDSAITANLTIITTNDVDVNINVKDTVTVNEARNIATSTTGTIGFLSGISDVKNNYISSAILTTSKFDDAIGAGGDPDVIITVTTTANAQEGHLIASQTSGPGYAMFNGGIQDTIANLAIDSGITANLTAITNNDSGVGIIITDVVTANEGNHVAGATTGTVVYSGGVSDVAINLSTDNAIENELNAIVTEDPDVNVTVTTEVTANQGGVIADSTSGTVIFNIGVNDVSNNFAIDSTLTGNFDSITTDDTDVDVFIKDSVTANQGAVIIGATTGTIEIPIGINDVANNLTTDLATKANLDTITSEISNIDIVIQTGVTVNGYNHIGGATSGSTTFLRGIKDVYENYTVGNPGFRTLDTDFSTILSGDTDIEMEITNAVDVQTGELLANATTGTGIVNFSGGIYDVIGNMVTGLSVDIAAFDVWFNGVSTANNTYIQNFTNYYMYRFDVTLPANNISDGGGDMYDGGNKLSIVIDSKAVSETNAYYGTRLDESDHGYYLSSYDAKYPSTTYGWFHTAFVWTQNEDILTLTSSGNTGTDGSGHIAVYPNPTSGNEQIYLDGSTSGSVAITRALSYNSENGRHGSYWARINYRNDPSIGDLWFTMENDGWGSDVTDYTATFQKQDLNNYTNNVTVTGENFLLFHVLLSRTSGVQIPQTEIAAFVEDYVADIDLGAAATGSGSTSSGTTGVISANFRQVTIIDTDVNITVSDTLTGANVIALNAVSGNTTGIVTATITGNADELFNLATSNTVDAITATVLDESTLTQANKISNSTTVPVVYNVGISDTSSNYITGDGASHELRIVTTDDPDISIAVQDNVTANEGEIIANMTTGTLNYLSGVTDTIGNYVIGTSSHPDLSTIVNRDTDVIINVTDSISTNQGSLLAGLSSGVATFTGGLSDIVGNLVSVTALTSEFNSVVTEDTDINVTVTSVVTMNDTELIDASTSGTTEYTLGLGDLIDNLAIDGITTTTLDGLISANSATNITIIDADITSGKVFSLNAVSDATTGIVTGTISGNADELYYLSTADTDVITITVNDTATAAQGHNIATATSVAVIFSGGITDTIVGLVNPTTEVITANFSSVTVNDGDVNVTVTDEVTANEGGVVSDNTTGTIDYSLGVNDVIINLTGTGAVLSTEFAKIISEDSNVPVTIGNGSIDITSAYVNHMNAVAGATSGIVTANISGTLSALNPMTNDCNNNDLITVRVTNADIGGSNVSALNTIASSTGATVTGTISGTAAQLDDLTTSNTTDAISITVTDAVSVSQASTISNTSTVAVVYQGGLQDTITNLTGASTLTHGTNVATIDDPDIDITVTNESLTDTYVSHLNVLTNATTGGITATISGNATELSALITSNTDDSITITVNDEATIAEGIAIVRGTNEAVVFSVGLNDTVSTLLSGTDHTNELSEILTDDSDIGIKVQDAVTLTQGDVVANATTGTVQYITGVNDTVLSMYTGGSIQPKLTNITTHDSDIPVEISGLLSHDYVEHLNAISAVTTGPVTASISGDSSELQYLITLDTDTVAITVNDVTNATTGNLVTTKSGTGVTFSGGITDTIGNLAPSGVATQDLTNITTDDTDVTIIVTDETNANEGEIVANATTGDVTFRIGINDTINNLQSGVSITDNLSTIVTANSSTRVNITDGDIGGTNITKLNTVVTGVAGVVTGNMSGSKMQMAALSSSNTDLITVTVINDYTGTQVSSLNTLAGKTGGVVTATINGTSSQLTSMTTIGTDLITVNVSGHAPISNLNIIANATGGTVTASVTANASEFDTLTTNNTTDAITVYVSDAISTSQIATLTTKTNIPISYNGGLIDTMSNLASSGSVTSAVTTAVDDDSNINITVSDTELTESHVININALASTTTGVLTATINGRYSELSGLTTSTSDLIAITVNERVTVEEGATISGLTSSSATVNYMIGINDTISNLVTSDSASSNFGIVLTRDSDVDVIVSDTVTASQGEVVANATTEGTVTYLSGVVDSISGLTSSGSITDDFVAITNNDSDIAVTVSGQLSDSSVSDLNAIATATDGVVTATISGNSAELAGLTTLSTDLINITVNDVITAAEGASIAGATSSSSTVIYSVGLNDTIAGLVSGSSITANLTTVVNLDSDINIIVSDTVTASEGELVANATTEGSVTYLSGVTDSLSGLASSGSATADLTAITNNDSDVLVYVNGTLNDQDVSDLNAVAGETSGTVTATIVGNSTDLSSLTTSNSVDAITIQVNDATTASDALTISNTSTIAVSYNGGMTDTLSNMASSGVITAGVNSATIDDSDINVIVSDALLSGTNVSDLNAVASATTGTMTATISGTAAQLDDLTTTYTTDAITANVTSAVTANQAGTINAATNTAVVYYGGMTDNIVQLSNSGTVTANVSVATTDDSDINITVSDSLVETNVDDLNALGVVTSGVLTASISGRAGELANLTTSNSTDAITITVNDGASASQTQTISDSTTIDVIYSGGIIDLLVNLASSGVITAGVNSAVIDDPDINITINDVTISGSLVDDVNSLATATSGVLTTSGIITGNANQLDDLTTSGSTDSISANVTSSATVSQVTTISGATSSVIYYGGINDTMSNFVSGGSVTAGVTTGISDDADITATVSDSLTEPNISDLNVLATAVVGTVTGSITGRASQLANLTTSNSVDAITITVNDSATIAQAAIISNATNISVIYSGGLVDVIANLAINGNLTAGTNSAIIDDSDITITVTDELTEADLTELNLLASSTDGAVTATITLNANLTGLTTNGSFDVITANIIQPVTALQGQQIVNDATTVNFHGGIDDYRGNLVGSGTETQAVIDMLTKDTDFDIQLQTTIDGALYADLNRLSAITDGTLNCEVDGTSSELVNLTTSNSKDNLIITVEDNSTAAQAAIISNTSSIAVTYYTIADTIANLASSGTISAGLNSATIDDSDVPVTVTDSNIGGGNIDNLNAVGESTTGILTGTLTANASSMDNLTTASTDAITANVITGASALQANTISNATSVAVVYYGGLLDTITGLSSSSALTDGTSIAITDDPDVAITVNDSDIGGGNVANLNIVSNATNGIVTGTIWANAVQASQLTTNDSRDLITVYVTDASTVSQGKTATEASTIAITFNGGITDTVGNLVTGTTTSVNLNAVTADQSDVNITVSDQVTLVEGDIVANATTGTVSYPLGLNDTLANLFNTTSNTVSDALTNVTTEQTDIDVCITDNVVGIDVYKVNAIGDTTTGTLCGNVNGTIIQLDDITTNGTTDSITINSSTTATVAQGVILIGATGVDVIFSGGLTDLLSNMATGGSLTSGLSGITGDDPDIAITINDTEIGGTNVSNLNVIGGATTGIVTGTITGTSAQLDDLTTSGTTDALTITVNSTATIAQASIVVNSTTLPVVFSSGITDSISNLTSGISASSGLTAAVTDDPDVNIVITGTLTGLDYKKLNAVAGSTTGTTTASITGPAADMNALTTTSTDPISIIVTTPVSDVQYTNIKTKTSLTVVFRGGFAKLGKVLLYTDPQTRERYLYAKEIDNGFIPQSKLLSDKLELSRVEEDTRRKNKIKNAWIYSSHNGKQYKYNTITKESRWI